MTNTDILDHLRDADSMARQHGSRYSVVDRAGRILVLPWAHAHPSDTVLETVRPPKVDRFGRVLR